MLTCLPDVIVITTLLTAGLFGGFGLFLIRKPAHPLNSVMLRTLMFVTALWLFAMGLTTITSTLPWKMHWHALQQAFNIMLPGLWTLFVLDYSGVLGPINRRKALLAALEPLVMIGIMATTGSHGLYWQAWHTSEFGSYTLLHTANGPAATVHMVFSNFLLMFATAALLRVISEPSNPKRRTAILLLLASITPWLMLSYGNQQSAPINLIAGLVPLTILLGGIIVIAGTHKGETSTVIPAAHKTIVDKLDDGIVILNAHGTIVDVNPAAARILQQPQAALVGQSALAVFATTPGMHDNYIVDTLHRSKIQISSPDGERHYAMQITALRDAEGAISGQLVSLHDITEHVQVEKALKQAREAAETANRTKSEFLANMSHELRTPLNAIIGYTDLTLMGTYGEITPLQRERLEQVSENGKHLATMISDLIDISRIEAHDFPLHLETFDPTPLLNDAVRTAEQEAADKNLKVHTNISEGLPMITADPRRLGQVVHNLIHNAIKFTHDGYIILHAGVITWKDANDFPLQLPSGPRRWLLIAVQDTGIGIAREDHSMIFEDFRQVDGSHTRNYQGSGLGLTVAFRFTRLMNGHMWVESSLHQGSTMYVLMPVFEFPEDFDPNNSLHNEDDPPLRHFMPHLN